MRASTASGDVARTADDAYVVDAWFDVDVPQDIAWPNGGQPARLAQSAIRGSIRKLLDEVRTDILARAAR